ncbi:MAG: hypothetical protein ACI35R_03295 [Bacillus sp. (in: firmicutes)]
MKKLPVVISLVSLLALAGCGNDSSSEKVKDPAPETDVSNENDKKPADDVATENETSTETEKETETETETEKESEATPETEKESDDAAKEETTDSTTEKQPASETDGDKEQTEAAAEKTLQYQLQGQTKEETAKLMESDNQQYSMYVLPGYELTGEEPRKDVLYLKDSDHISMRIELLSENPDWATYEANIPTELQDTNQTVTNPTEPELQVPGASIYEASNGQDRVTIYLVKNVEQPMKLTIFTTEKEDYRSAFVEMAKTITSK